MSSPAAKQYVGFNEYFASHESLHQFGRAVEALQQNEGANEGQSWAACLLPYLGSEHQGHAALKAFDPNLDWNEGSNAELARRVIPAFINPLSDNRTTSDGFGVAHFAGNVHAFRASANSHFIHHRREDHLPSLLIGEAILRSKAWADPSNLRDPSLGLNRSPDGFVSRHSNSGGVLFLLSGGSVRYLNNDIDPEVMQYMSRAATSK